MHAENKSTTNCDANLNDCDNVYEKKTFDPKENDFVIDLICEDRSNNTAKQDYLIRCRDNAYQFRLPIGKTGEEYRACCDLFDSRGSIRGLPDSIRFEVKCSPAFREVGLSCERDKRGQLIVSGRPLKPLDVVVYIRVIDALNKNEMQTTTTLSIITNDPFDLWQVNDPPKDIPYPQEELDVCEARSVKLRKNTLLAIGASKRGRMHEHNGTCRDDSFSILMSEDPYDWHFFAVADGAGSARFSRVGARIACETATQGLKKFFQENRASIDDLFVEEIERLDYLRRDENEFTTATNDFVRKTNIDKIFSNVVYDAYVKIVEEAKEMARLTAESTSPYYGKMGDTPIGVRDYHTTLLCAAVKCFGRVNDLKDKPNSRAIWALATYWVGDGALAFYRSNARVKGVPTVELLGEADGGEYAGETRFLTMKEEATLEKVSSRARVSFLRSFDRLTLATDGVTDPIFESDAQLKDLNRWNYFWSDFLKENAERFFDESADPQVRAQALLDGMKFKIRGNHDDRTMLVVFTQPNDDPPSDEERENPSYRTSYRESY